MKYSSDYPASAVIVNGALAQPIWDKAVIWCAFIVTAGFFVYAALSGAYGLIRYLIARKRRKFLEQNGVLRDGEIIVCHRKLIGKYRNKAMLTVVFKFMTPEGVEIVGKQRVRRDDLTSAPLPGSG